MSQKLLKILNKGSLSIHFEIIQSIFLDPMQCDLKKQYSVFNNCIPFGRKYSFPYQELIINTIHI